MVGRVKSHAIETCAGVAITLLVILLSNASSIRTAFVLNIYACFRFYAFENLFRTVVFCLLKKTTLPKQSNL